MRIVCTASFLIKVVVASAMVGLVVGAILIH
jgi:hypothetical protein